MSKKYVEGRKAAIVVEQKIKMAVFSLEQLREGHNKLILLQFEDGPNIESYEFVKEYCDLRISALQTRASMKILDKTAASEVK